MNKIIGLNYFEVTEDGSGKVENQGYQIIMLDLADGSRQDVTDIMQMNVDISGMGIRMLTEKNMIYTIFQAENCFSSIV